MKPWNNNTTSVLIQTVVHLHPASSNINLTILKTIQQLHTTHKSVKALSCPRALYEREPWMSLASAHGNLSCPAKPIWFSFCSLNTPNSFSTHRFCTFWSFCPENYSQGSWLNWLLSIFKDWAQMSPSFLNFYLGALPPLTII